MNKPKGRRARHNKADTRAAVVHLLDHLDREVKGAFLDINANHQELGFDKPPFALDEVGIASARLRQLEAGYWRCPAPFPAGCANCGKEFPLTVWLEQRPTPEMVGQSLPVKDSEGGLIIDNAVVKVDEDGLRCNWVPVCDDCAPF